MGVDLRLEHADEREIAVFFRVVKAVADDECIRHFKAGIRRVDRRFAARRFVQQRRNGDRRGTADTEIVRKVVQRNAAVENVLDATASNTPGVKAILSKVNKK